MQMDLDHPETRLARHSSKASPAPPNSARQIAAQIGRLLSHYWTADEPVALRQAQAEDWLDDLSEFPPEIVAAVCREWRRNETRRPLPAELRRLCKDEVASRQPLLPKPPPITLEEATARAEEYARRNGFKSLADYHTHYNSLSVCDGAGGFYSFHYYRGVSHDRPEGNFFN